MKKLNVTHINFSDDAGGAASIMNDLVQVQRNAGHYPVRYCARPSLQETKLLGFGDGPKASLGLKVVTKISTVRNRVFGDTYGICANNYYQKLLETKADIFHIHNIHGGWFPLSLIVRLSKIAPIVWTLHDEWAYSGHCVSTFGCSKWQTGCGNCPNLGTMVKMWKDTTARNHKYRAMIYNLLPPQASAAVTVSNWLATRLKKSDIWPGIIKTIPNGIKLDHFYPVPKHNAREQLGVAPDVDVILCCAAGGTANPFKNAELALESLKHIPENKKITAIVIGGGPEPNRSTQAMKSVIFTGYIKNRDLLRTYYAAGDLLVYPTKADTFGLVAAEAMACGTPVLATGIGGITDVVINGENGSLMAENTSPAALASVICQLLEDKEKLGEMRERGIQHIIDNFSVDLMNRSYLSLYRDLIAGKQTCQKH